MRCKKEIDKGRRKIARKGKRERDKNAMYTVLLDVVTQ